MKTRKIGYWVTTGLVALGFFAGGLFDLSGAPDVVSGLQHLGYPAYFAALLGTWKVLGALAIVAPGLPRLKEWAYAGMVFDLTGAFVSHAAVGDGVDKLTPPLVLLALAVASWALRPDARKLAAPRAPKLGESAPRLDLGSAVLPAGAAPAGSSAAPQGAH